MTRGRARHPAPDAVALAAPWPAAGRIPPQTFWALCRRGEDERSAAELTAYIFGLPPMAEGEVLAWTDHEISSLLFLRELIDRGALGGPG